MKIQLLAIIAQVLRRRFRIPTVERLREDVIRTEDSMVTALTLVEQIEKRGEHGWIEPLVEDIGAWLLLQLGDLANLLEVVLKYVVFIVFRCITHSSTWNKLLIDSHSFYEWRQPRQTAYTLSLFAFACLAFYLTPSWLLVKSITLNAGLVFFGLFPIGSRYPDYRLLASPAKWLFWNIPNHGDLAHFKRSISTRL